MIVLQDRMATPAVHVQYNSIRSIEDAHVLRPAIQAKRGGDVGLYLQAFMQQLHACVEFVIARSVAGTPGNKNNLCSPVRVDGADDRFLAKKQAE